MDDRAARLHAVVRLRSAGLDYQAIGDELGMAPEDAEGIVAGLVRHARQDAEGIDLSRQVAAPREHDQPLYLLVELPAGEGWCAEWN